MEVKEFTIYYVNVCLPRGYSEIRELSRINQSKLSQYYLLSREMSTGNRGDQVEILEYVGPQATSPDARTHSSYCYCAAKLVIHTHELEPNTSYGRQRHNNQQLNYAFHR